MYDPNIALEPEEITESVRKAYIDILKEIGTDKLQQITTQRFEEEVGLESYGEQPSPNGIMFDDPEKINLEGEFIEIEETQTLDGFVSDDAYRDFANRALNHKILSREEEITLAKRIEKGDMHAKNQLIEHNQRLVVSIARKFLSKSHKLELLDLVSFGNIGLIRATEKFDYRQGYKFSTYATWWIKQSIGRGIANTGRSVRAPVHIEAALRKTEEAEAGLTIELGRPPTDSEIAEYLDEDEETITHLRNIRRTQAVASLNTPISDDSAVEYGDRLADDSVDVLGEVISNGAKEQLGSVLSHLPPLERQVIEMLYGTDDSPKLNKSQCAEMLNLDYKRIAIIEERAINNIRQIITGYGYAKSIEEFATSLSP